MYIDRKNERFVSIASFIASIKQIEVKKYYEVNSLIRSFTVIINNIYCIYTFVYVYILLLYLL